MADWPKIRTEYIEGSDSITTLAKKHGVNPNTARYHFRHEHWSEMRREVRRRACEISIETAAVRRAKLAALLDEAGLKVLESIMAILDHHKSAGYTELIQTGEELTVVFKLLELVDSLVKLARIYGLDAASQMKRQSLELLKLNPEYYSGEPGPAIVISTASDRESDIGWRKMIYPNIYPNHV